MTEQFRPIDLIRPPRIVFGAGTANRAGAWLAERGLSRILVVADAFNAARLDALGLTGEVSVFADIRAEPDTAALAAAVEAAESARAQAVVGFGGGSAMDLAKLAAVLPGSGLSLAQVSGVGRVPPRRVALVQVPTTAGTGSEAGPRALIADPESGAKVATESPEMMADLAAIDPALTMTVPPAVTAATGVDALAHCVEAFTNRKAHPAIDLYAREGIRLAGRWLPRAVAHGGDVDARAALALASLYGGICLGPVNTAAGHAVAYPLGTRFHVPHGAANALIFPHVLAFNAPAVPERTAEILAALGLPESADPAAVFASARAWCAGLGHRMRMSDYGVTEADLPAMADEAHAIRRLLDNNPRDLGRDQILAIYRAAL